MKKTIWMLVSCLLLQACATIHKETPAADEAAKQFRTEIGKAVVYVYRDSIFGGAITTSLVVDDKPTAKLRGKDFVRFEVEPGIRILGSQVPNDPVIYLQLQTEPGKIYFVQLVSKYGNGVPYFAPTLVDSLKGQAGVQECSLVQSY